MDGFANSTKAFAELASKLPTSPAAVDDLFKNSTETYEKVFATALGAAQKNADITGKWTKETLNHLEAVAAAKEDSAEYAKAAGDFATAAFESATDNFVAYAEVAKNAQLDTVKALFAAGK